MTERDKGDEDETFDPFAAPPTPEAPASPHWPSPEQTPPAVPPTPVPATPGPRDRAAWPSGGGPMGAPGERSAQASFAPRGPKQPPAGTGSADATGPGRHNASGPAEAGPADTGSHAAVTPTETRNGPTAPSPGNPSQEQDGLTEPYDRRTSYGAPPMRDDPAGPWGANSPGGPIAGAPPQPGWPAAGGRPTERPGTGRYAPGGPPTTQFTPDQQRDGSRWNTGEPQRSPAAAAGGGSPDYNYADRIRPSELVRTRKVPPGRGWRKFVLAATFGLINLGQSPDERRVAELEQKIRSLLRGRYKIGVLGKGGTGKTTIAASVGSILAELRQEDRVVAVDADTAFGKLGSRVDPSVSGSYWELAADQHLHTFADVRSRVGNNTAGLFVLPGERSVARRRVLDPAIYREATSRLDNHFTITIVDCGSTMDSPVTREALQDLDALIIVSSPWLDAASAAAQTMDWLSGNGYTGLLHRTVIVINDTDGHSQKNNLRALAEEFGRGGQVVVQMPYDGHLRPGGVIDVGQEVQAETRRRFVEIAAAIAEHFPATTDRPRERR